jgi:hypothetical protein
MKPGVRNNTKHHSVCTCFVLVPIARDQERSAYVLHMFFHSLFIHSLFIHSPGKGTKKGRQKPPYELSFSKNRMDGGPIAV